MTYTELNSQIRRSETPRHNDATGVGRTGSNPERIGRPMAVRILGTSWTTEPATPKILHDVPAEPVKGPGMLSFQALQSLGIESDLQIDSSPGSHLVL